MLHWWLFVPEIQGKPGQHTDGENAQIQPRGTVRNKPVNYTIYLDTDYQDSDGIGSKQTAIGGCGLHRVGHNSTGFHGNLFHVVTRAW
jgi:hypothetical protein